MGPFVQSVEQALADAVSVTEIARAKINLALHVLDRRSDGFHNLETLAVFADYGDLVSAHDGPPATAISLDMHGAFADDLAGGTLPQDNLILRAARQIARSADARAPVRIVLNKRLPLEAGLGGGSADAAATLHLLNRRWQAGLSGKSLVEEARQLGADVPMCIVSRPLVASGIGDRMRPARGIPALPVVLAFPGGGLPTAAVFRALDAGPRTGLPPMPERFRRIIDFVHWLRQTRNDLAHPAAEVSSLAGAAARALHRDEESLFARMTGSGTSAFGIFASLPAAERAAKRIAMHHPDWWVIATMTGASPDRVPGSA